MSAKEKTPPGQTSIAKNRKALFNYAVEDSVEAGICLLGTEVKSLREGNVHLIDAYAMIENREAFVHQISITEYSRSGYATHVPRRARKLLLHRAEIERLHRKVQEKGFTLIPLELYFKNGRVKVKLGLCRGKKEYDKRATIRDRDLEREGRR